MQVLVTTNRGLEDICAQEVKEILNVDAKVRPFGILGRVMFEVKDIMDAIYFTYVTRTANRVILFLHHFEVERDKKGLDTIYREVKNLDLNFLKQEMTFAIRSERMGIHEYTSLDIMRVAGQAVIDKIMEERGYRQRVNLENPDVIIRVDVIGDHGFIGLDLVGEKGLHKRGYKIYHHPAALKTTLAQQLVMLSGWDGNGILLDPMCGSGTICIEAGLRLKNIPGAFWRKRDLQFTKLDLGVDWIEWMREIDEKLIRKVSGKRIIGSDKSFRHVKGAEINSEKALVRDVIEWRRIDLEWLDIKIGQGEIDYIVTNPPYGVKLSYKEEIEKIYKYLFYQADWCLKSGGVLTVITNQKNLILECAKKYNFELIHERKAWNGNLEVFVFKFKKS